MLDINFLSREASDLLLEYTRLFSEKIDELQSKKFIEELERLKKIHLLCQSSSESVVWLVGKGKIWDAEVIRRPIMEGTIRSLWLSIGTDDEKMNKSIDFFENLEKHSVLRRSSKAKSSLRAINKEEDPDFAHISQSILSNEVVENIKNNDHVKKSKDNWDFNKLLQLIADSGIPGGESFKAFSIDYYKLSTVVHMEASAINTIFDRIGSGSVIFREISNYAHALSIIDNTLSWAKFRYDCLSLWSHGVMIQSSKTTIHETIDKESVQTFRKLHKLASE